MCGELNLFWDDTGMKKLLALRPGGHLYVAPTKTFWESPDMSVGVRDGYIIM